MAALRDILDQARYGAELPKAQAGNMPNQSLDQNIIDQAAEEWGIPTNNRKYPDIHADIIAAAQEPPEEEPEPEQEAEQEDNLPEDPPKQGLDLAIRFFDRLEKYGIGQEQFEMVDDTWLTL